MSSPLQRQHKDGHGMPSPTKRSPFVLRGVPRGPERLAAPDWKSGLGLLAEDSHVF